MSNTRTREGITAGFKKRKPHFVRKRRFAKAFWDAHNYRVATELRNCQETKLLASCTHCGKFWYVVSKCNLRVCPLCSYERSKERTKYITALTKHMQFPKMLTLTMPLWTEDPREGIKYLRESWNTLRRTKVFQKIRGGCYQIEVKGKPEGWHIHMHVLMDAPYLPRQYIFSKWKKILKVEAPQVHIIAAQNAKQKGYVAKYTAKTADFHSDPTAIVDWYNATKGLRLFATFGEWYNAKLEDLEPDEKPYVPEVLCPHCGEHKTTYFARDGPFVYGGKDWNHVKKFLPPEGDYLLKLQDIDAAVDASFYKDDADYLERKAIQEEHQ